MPPHRGHFLAREAGLRRGMEGVDELSNLRFLVLMEEEIVSFADVGSLRLVSLSVV